MWQVVIKVLVEKEETSKIFPTPTCGFVVQLLVVPANQSLIFFQAFSLQLLQLQLAYEEYFFDWFSSTGQRKFISVQAALKFHWKLFLDLFSLTLYSLILGTASDNIAAAIDAYKKGHPYRCDREGIVNIGVGKVTNNCCQEMKHRLRHDLFLFLFFFNVNKLLCSSALQTQKSGSMHQQCYLHLPLTELLPKVMCLFFISFLTLSQYFVTLWPRTQTSLVCLDLTRGNFSFVNWVDFVSRRFISPSSFSGSGELHYNSVVALTPLTLNVTK